MGFLRMLQRRRYRAVFGQYLSPEVIEMLLAEKGAEIKPPEVKHFQFVVALADDRNPLEVPVMLSKITRTLIQHHSMVTHITSSLVVALLGVPFPEGNSAEARRELVGALLRENGDRLRIAHGECEAAVGMFGGPQRCTYGAVIPEFSGILKTLLETKLGSAVEYRALQ
jgi:hypothetical protein